MEPESYPQHLLHDYVNSWKSGSTESFNCIYRLYYRRLEAFLYGIVGSRTESEELVQDVFLKLWNNREKIDISRSVDAYIFTIARHHAFNHLRARHSHVMIDEDVNLVASTETDQGLLVKELEASIQAALLELPHQRQRVFRLSRVEGLPNSEIARRLSISVKTVENHITLALKSLRQTLPTILVGVLFLLITRL